MGPRHPEDVEVALAVRCAPQEHLAGQEADGVPLLRKRQLAHVASDGALNHVGRNEVHYQAEGTPPRTIPQVDGRLVALPNPEGPVQDHTILIS